MFLSISEHFMFQYQEFFDDQGEQHVPTWSVLTWLLEGYGQSRTEIIAADLIYKQVSGP